MQTFSSYKTGSAMPTSRTVIYASLVSHSREQKAREYFIRLPPF